jgi:hypothetical protein
MRDCLAALTASCSRTSERLPNVPESDSIGRATKGHETMTRKLFSQNVEPYRCCLPGVRWAPLKGYGRSAFSAEGYQRLIYLFE